MRSMFSKGAASQELTLISTRGSRGNEVLTFIFRAPDQDDLITSAMLP